MYESHESVLQNMEKSLEGIRKDRPQMENDTIFNFLRSVTRHLGKTKNEICGMKECKAFEGASGSNVRGVGKSKTSKVVKAVRKVLTKGKTVTSEALNVTSFSADLDRLEEYHNHTSESLLTILTYFRDSGARNDGPKDGFKVFYS